MSENVSNMHCGECGREMTKAHRVHKGQRYCATCYAGVFKRRVCPKCGDFARLQKNDEKAVCKKCESDQPCIRCGKTEYEVGKISPYGPVCNSCAPHFREPNPCGLCGRPSSRLTRVMRAGVEVPVCPKCASQDHGTCQACRRRRPLQKAPDGRLLCKVCLEKGEVPCQSCGKWMPAGRGNVCEACYWQETFRKRLKLDQAAFSMPEIENAFGEFGEWLLAEVGGQKAALSIHRYLPFFVEFESRWKGVPGYADLLAHFGAEGLRRVRLPMRWLKDVHGVVPDANLREEDSERRRIEAIMASVPNGTSSAKALTGYRNSLTVRVKAGKTTLRSFRMALRPAASLLLAGDESGAKLPDQDALDRYLLEAPGQKAAVTGFVNYLCKTHGLVLEARVVKRKVRKTRRRRLEKKLMALMRLPEMGEEASIEWIMTALEYFHGVKVPKSIAAASAYLVDDGYNVVINDTNFWLPFHTTSPDTAVVDMRNLISR